MLLGLIAPKPGLGPYPASERKALCSSVDKKIKVNKFPTERSKYVMNRTLQLLIALSISGWVYAADAGTTSAGFLKLGAGARASGMADAMTAVADDAYATTWNPAGLAQIETSEVAFSHNSYLQNTSQDYAAFVIPQEKLGTFGGSVNFFNVGGFQGYDASGQKIGNVKADDLAVAGSYARPIVEDRRKGSRLAVGVTGKWIHETLDTVSANALAMDAGLHWTAGRSFGEELNGLRAGVVVKNIGSGMKYDSATAPLPRSISAGLAWTGVWLGESLTLAADAEQPQAGKRILHAGLELSTFRTFVVRGGFTNQGDLGNGLRLGAGIRFRTIHLDYAFSAAGDLGTAHRVGIRFRFGEKVPEPLVLAESWFEKGMKDYRRGRYSEALAHFNKALEMDPAHPEALKMMKQTYEQIRGPVETNHE